MGSRNLPISPPYGSPSVFLGVRPIITYRFRHMCKQAYLVPQYSTTRVPSQVFSCAPQWAVVQVALECPPAVYRAFVLQPRMHKGNGVSLSEFGSWTKAPTSRTSPPRCSSAVPIASFSPSFTSQGRSASSLIVILSYLLFLRAVSPCAAYGGDLSVVEYPPQGTV